MSHDIHLLPGAVAEEGTVGAEEVSSLVEVSTGLSPRPSSSTLALEKNILFPKDRGGGCNFVLSIILAYF